jgi:hypothetical protein
VVQDHKSEITLVTAFFDISRATWKSYARTPEYYLDSFMNYLKLGYVMIVFVDSRYLHFFENINSKLITVIPIDFDFLNENIYAWKTLSVARKIMKSNEYYELVQTRITSGNPENIYPEYNCINHAKIDFINYALPFIRSPFVCWSDFGYHSSILKNDISILNFNLFF